MICYDVCIYVYTCNDVIWYDMMCCHHVSPLYPPFRHDSSCSESIALICHLACSIKNPHHTNTHQYAYWCASPSWPDKSLHLQAPKEGLPAFTWQDLPSHGICITWFIARTIMLWCASWTSIHIHPDYLSWLHVAPIIPNMHPKCHQGQPPRDCDANLGRPRQPSGGLVHDMATLPNQQVAIYVAGAGSTSCLYFRRWTDLPSIWVLSALIEGEIRTNVL